MVFIFAEDQGMQTAAVRTAALADETIHVGTQSLAAGAPVVPPGLDPVSAFHAASIKAYTSHIAGHLTAGAGFQNDYGRSVSHAGNAYTLTDHLNAIGLSQ
jgi:PE family protein